MGRKMGDKIKLEDILDIWRESKRHCYVARCQQNSKPFLIAFDDKCNSYLMPIMEEWNASCNTSH